MADSVMLENACGTIRRMLISSINTAKKNNGRDISKPYTQFKIDKFRQKFVDFSIAPDFRKISC